MSEEGTAERGGFDSSLETIQHSRRVDELLLEVIAQLQQRLTKHDASKLEPPEKEIFDEFTPLLKTSTYGSDEYKAYLQEMGIALEHHYAGNRHHPEHGEELTQWRPIEGYEGFYEVSDLGDVWSVERVVERSGPTGNVTKMAQARKAHLTPKGYVRVSLVRDGIQRNFMVHRLVAQAFVPNPDGKPEVNHKDGNKSNNAAWNLEWVTSSENQIHAYDSGLKESNVKYVVHCPELDLTTLGTTKMEAALRSRGYDRAHSSGIWYALDTGRKHLDLTFEGTLLAEHRRSMIERMTLVDVIEMLADWKAATERHDDGDLATSLRIQKGRFGISDQLVEIMRNTAEENGWL